MSTTSSMLSPFLCLLRSNVARAVGVGLLAGTSVTGVLLPPEPAVAQQVVFDPKNHLENALQAARQLEGLANDATQLANEARMLATSPLKVGAKYSETLKAINDTAEAARGIATDVARVERQFQDLYSGDLRGRDLADLTRTGAERIRVSAETKANKGRPVYLNAVALEVLKRLDGERPQPRTLDQRVILYRHKGKGRPKPIASVKKAWESTLERVGLKEPGAPARYRFHDTRAAFCSYLAEQGVDPVHIKELAGHADITTTMRYVRASNSRLKEAVTRLEPGMARGRPSAAGTGKRRAG